MILEQKKKLYMHIHELMYGNYTTINIESLNGLQNASTNKV